MKYSILKRFCLKPIISIKRKRSERKRNEDAERHIRSIEEILLKLKEIHEKFRTKAASEGWSIQRAMHLLIVRYIEDDFDIKKEDR